MIQDPYGRRTIDFDLSRSIHASWYVNGPFGVTTNLSLQSSRQSLLLGSKIIRVLSLSSFRMSIETLRMGWDSSMRYCLFSYRLAARLGLTGVCRVINFSMQN